jgi:prepilin-type N-terminal cleavage/methylation domain-containing protein
MRKSNSRRGMTMIEILVVVAIMAVFSGLAVTNITQAINVAKNRGDLSTIQQMLADARARAISTGETHAVHFLKDDSAGQQTITIYKIHEAWTSCSDNYKVLTNANRRESASVTNQTTLAAGTLAAGTTEITGNSSATVVFDRDGVAAGCLGGTYGMSPVTSWNVKQSSNVKQAESSQTFVIDNFSKPFHK